MEYPYEKEYKCSNKDCSNTWNITIKSPIPILMCGGHAKVCRDCEEQGYSVYDGKGDGKFYLSRNGDNVAVYDYNTAYNITDEDHDIF